MVAGVDPGRTKAEYFRKPIFNYLKPAKINVRILIPMKNRVLPDAIRVQAAQVLRVSLSIVTFNTQQWRQDGWKNSRLREALAEH
jgi:hypothetical protein